MDTAQVREFFNSPIYLGKRAGIVWRGAMVRDLVGDARGLSIVDLGCGDGSISLQFAPENRITLVDIAENMLEEARRNIPLGSGANVSLVHGDLDAPAADGKYDLVMCLGVLAHVPSVDQAIARIASLTRIGGRCIVQFTDRDRLLGKLDYRYSNLRNRKRRESRYLTNRTGYTEIARLLERNGCLTVGLRRTWPTLPGMGRLSDECLGKYAFFTSENRILRPFGSETIVMAERR